MVNTEVQFLKGKLQASSITESQTHHIYSSTMKMVLIRCNKAFNKYAFANWVAESQATSTRLPVGTLTYYSVPASMTSGSFAAYNFFFLV